MNSNKFMQELCFFFHKADIYSASQMRTGFEKTPDFGNSKIIILQQTNFARGKSLQTFFLNEINSIRFNVLIPCVSSNFFHRLRISKKWI